MVYLIPMEENDYQAFLKVAVAEYAEDHVKAGNWQPAEAQARSAQEFQQLLPNGVSTENNYLYTICDDSGTHVGMIWFAVFTNRAAPRAFIYDFRIDEPYRGKGYGKAALLAVEEKVKELGVNSIGLHVFNHNQTALALYEKVGYQVMSLNMLKQLE